MDDARTERDLLADDAVGIAVAVEPLVVVADRGHRVLEEAETVDDPRALLRVALHQRPLLAGEARRLQQDRVRDRKLADVVEERRVTEQVELRLREVELPADGERKLLHASRMAGRVRVSRVDRRRERLHRRRRALAQRPVGLLERHVLRLDRVRRLAQLLCRSLRVREVRLLRLAHQEQRHGEDREAVEADGRVADAHHGADEAVHDVVRQEPGETLVEHGPRALVTLDPGREAQQAHVDEEVQRAACESECGDGEPAAVAGARPDREDGSRRERRHRHRADVVDDGVERVAARAPIDDGDRDRHRQRRAIVEERSAGE